MKKWALISILFLPLSSQADILSLYFLNNLSVQYEGTGFRERPAGWELKVKPQGLGQGLRWRRGPFQAQLWRNNPYYSWEDGNSAGPVERQTGATRLAVQNAVFDARWPFAFGGRCEAAAGLQAAHVSFDRKDVVFNAVLSPGDRERLQAAGLVLGLHGGWEGRRFWWDGEFLTGHFFWTRNRLRTDGGSIRRDGYSYVMRIEAGWRGDRWRVGLGLVRQMLEILVPGGKALPNGAAASLPINKIDFESPFLSLSWSY